MSQPVDPYRRDPRYQQPYGQPSYGEQPQPYGGQPQFYGEPQQQPYGGPPREPYQPQYAGGRPHQPPPAGHGVPTRPATRRPATAVRRRRIPGLGLVLTVLGLVVQLLSLTVLPWLRFGAVEPGDAATPTIWQLAAEHQAHGFGGWFVVLFSYPVAVLSILLALASVLQSVALKMIWGGLTLIGLGVLVVRYGLGPLAGDGRQFTTLEIVLAIVAVAALVVMIFMLRTAVSMFRRVAGLILLGITGVHVAAIANLAHDIGAESLGIGAYGPALGYLLTAIAAFAGPRGLPGRS